MSIDRQSRRPNHAQSPQSGSSSGLQGQDNRDLRHFAALSGRGGEPGSSAAGCYECVRPPVGLQRGEYDFLLGAHIDRETVDFAEATAWHWGVHTHEAMIALGWLSQAQYLAALGAILGLDVIDTEVHLASVADRGPAHGRGDEPSHSSYPWLVRAICDGPGAPAFFALDGLAHRPSEIRSILAQSSLGARQVVLVPRAVLLRGYERGEAAKLLDASIEALRRSAPDLSAGTPIWMWQILSIVGLGGLCIGGFIITPGIAVAVMGGALTIPFLCVVLLRVLALAGGLLSTTTMSEAAAGAALRADDLPFYTVLVPLYHEPEILGDLIDAISALEYPAAKLEVLLILESVDHETQGALAALSLPPQFRTVVVPDAMPRTKPKALNYALQLAQGDYIVVYDAEDVPEPDQLRRAVARFRNGPANLACVQARLNIYNPYDSWLTRQFTIEYSALFDALLPALERIGIPIPLGGTSNHFPRVVLQQLGGWDPFNVTEDADLGIRMARAGLRTQIIASTTFEEAPARLSLWMPQRTRWLKGWMQTYLVHSRRPLRLLRDLGLWRNLGLHVLMGGILVSALVHPLFYIIAGSHLAIGEFLQRPSSAPAWILWWVAGFNLALGFVSSMALGGVAVIRRGRWRLFVHVLLMPLYWLLISFAAYRALWQLARDPYKWEKTDHVARSNEK